ncbi:MAG TPA: hypothetical protein DIT13_02490 [Verrucomicrobiales bacterium]|nr:hypothetical protein [Verrucomicrobiales bacterium]HRJ10670.1 hypothetical protein [Prosthecobacter sp.]HRK16534.1 hypothetical protein [Prosthecobacter sp.]
MTINHITLMTGDNVLHRLDIIPPEVVEQCRELLPEGGQIPGFPAFRVEIHAPVFTIWRGREPIATCGLGQGEDDVWSTLRDLQARFAPVKARPPAGRWLAVVLLPGLLTTAREDVHWLADFERCLAAAMLLEDVA